MDMIINTLADCPIFKDISKKDILNMLTQVDYLKKDFAKNQFIYRVGDQSRYLCIIISGCIEVKKLLTSGNVVSVFHRNRGEVFGGAVIFSDKSVYPYDFIAKEKSEVLFISKTSIFEVLCKNTAIASNMLTIFANRILQYEEKLELFSYSSIRKKIAFSLLHDFELSDNGTVVMPFTKTTWAERLNVSRPSLSRELRIFCDQDILQINRKSMAILRKDMLEDLL